MFAKLGRGGCVHDSSPVGSTEVCEVESSGRALDFGEPALVLQEQQLSLVLVHELSCFNGSA